MSRTPTVTRRQLVFGSTLGAGVLLSLVLLIAVNYLANRHYNRMDWTRSQFYTLSEKSLNILGSLDQTIEIVVFIDGGEAYEPVKEIVARYAAAADQIQVEFVDRIKNLARAQQLVDSYDLQRADVVVFVGETDRRVVTAAELIEYDYSAMQMGGAPEMIGFKGEQVFTRTILELVEHKKPQILFTVGHGELKLDGFDESGLSRLQDFLGQDNFELNEWSSLGATDVPVGTDLVVVAGPTAALTPPELQAFSRFLDQGGRMFVLIDPQLAGAGELSIEPVSEWLNGYGIETPTAMVIDPAKLLPFFGAETIFADAYGVHPITEALQQTRQSNIFPLVRPVMRADEGGEAVVELVRTSADGWGETDLVNLGAVELSEQDVAGPVSLAVALELGGGPEEISEASEPAEESSDSEPSAGRLVVFGDSDFLSNAQLGQAGNASLVANIMNWLVERESHLGIAPRETEDVRLSLTPSERRFMFWLVIFGLPSLCAIIGIYSHLQRRRR